MSLAPNFGAQAQMASNGNDIATVINDNKRDMTEPKTLKKPILRQAENFSDASRFSVEDPDYLAVYLKVKPGVDEVLTAKAIASLFWEHDVPVAVFVNTKEKLDEDVKSPSISKIYSLAEEQKVYKDYLFNDGEIMAYAEYLADRFKRERKPGGRVYEYLRDKASSPSVSMQ